MKKIPYSMAVLVLGSLASFASAQPVVGVLYPEMNLKLAMADNGVIRQVHVKSGSLVKAMDPLVTLDSTMQTLEMTRNKLIWLDTKEQQSLVARRVILAKKYAVAQALYQESRSISLDELDGLQLQLIDLDGQIAQLTEREEREQLEYEISAQRVKDRVLRAPVAGIVTQVVQHQGEWAPVGEPIIGLVDVTELFVKLNIRDVLARNLTLGAELPVTIENLPIQQGFIDYIAPIADAASGLVEIKIKLNNPDGVMRPGVRVSVELVGR
ncbi:efflux RND transporter periplasmic adaptor subunit [Marinomonas sp. IMCC 4694]|uniref:efflux RND transporter periplasmic adaptor subunit n=1 Tax=Marinomonas sp. IMCC 4694 TaxID=2605432 RepID=UPI0011E8861F|nr:efflux RND transporter periplasmic adaptor subunit [Marinomonas sp. IMCC 4694]TYL45824.1 HlyD family efflux transporter periplasmic adaptor subunit [Marinomonas sp. IMCC 4694]